MINDGEDGSGFEFVFTRRMTISVLTAPASTAQQRAMDDYVPTGYTDDPVGVTEDVRYEYVSVRTGSTGVWSEFGVPVLWSVFSEDGEDGVTITSITTLPSGRDPRDVLGHELHHHPARRGRRARDHVDHAVQHHRLHHRHLRRRRDTDEFLINDGMDGNGFEFVFTRRTMEARLPRPTSDRTVDDSVPTGYTDDPVGVNQANPFEYVSVRTEHHRDVVGVGRAGPLVHVQRGRHGRAENGIDALYASPGSVVFFSATGAADSLLVRVRRGAGDTSERRAPTSCFRCRGAETASPAPRN